MDKMRQEFEAWAGSIGFTLKPNAFGNGDYAMGYGWQEWNAWRASRAALCVELPKDISGEYYADGWNSALASVEVRLRESGVGFK